MVLQALTDEESKALLWDWEFWARPKQLPPDSDWRTWLLQTGRGFGKTRSGAMWIHRRAMEEKRWIALIAQTPADARDYMIEGPGGLLQNTPEWERPKYYPSKRRIVWSNGSWATVFSAQDADQLRGYTGDTAWLDELAKYPNPREVWEMLEFGLREASSDRPRICITTTPRPLTLLKEIIAKPSTILVHGTSYENRSNLDPTWFSEVIDAVAQTHLGRQEAMGELLDEMAGSLWKREMIEKCRVPLDSPLPDMVKIVIGLDPPGSSKGEDAAEAGIVAVGKGTDGKGYVLDDMSRVASPAKWAQTAVDLLEDRRGDWIIGERNNGGEMVEHTIRTVDDFAPVKTVWASRGKRTRAEPFVSLYQRVQVHHVGGFPDLEDQMCTWEPDEGQRSPDRMDALVWALAELFPPRRKRSITFGD